MSRLPIDSLHDAFLEALEAGPPVVVAAPTGSGKSTRLPLWMAETGRRVLVVEPRRVACRSLAGYLARDAKGGLGGEIGYRVRFEDKSSSATRVLFVTPGMALRMLRRPERFDFDAVLLDEFHERGWETDLALVLFRRRLASHSGMRLAITSATLDVEAVTHGLGATRLESGGRTYPVTIRHKARPDYPTGRDLEARVERAVADLARSGELDGDVLVFLPGKGEIARCRDALSGLVRSHDLELVSVHGSIPTSQLARAFEAKSPRRRVFLATNVAETSITLPGVTTVIDSGLARVVLHRAGRTALALDGISAAAMDQRAGRAGRVRPGRCIRLFNESYRAPETTSPELLRVELDEVLLRAADCGLDGPEFDAAPWLDPPPDFALERARERLSKMGLVDHAGRVTERGREIASLPVDVHEARLLLDAPEGVAGAVADLVALLAVGRDLFLPTFGLPSDGRERVDEARRALLEGVSDEVYAHLHALRDGHVRRHHLHGSALAEARKHRRRLRAMVGARSEHALPEREALASYLLERLPEAGFVLRPRVLEKKKSKGRGRKGRGPVREPWANGEGDEIFVSPWSPPFPRDPSEPDPRRPVAGVLLDHTWLGQDGRSVRGVGRMLLPCSLEQMADAGLGDMEVADATLRSGRVVGQRTRVLAGVVLRSEETSLTGAPLHTAAARLILNNRLLKGAREAVLDALHLASLLRGWQDEPDWTWLNGASPDDLPDPEDALGYVTAKLAELGVERSEDFALLEPSDLVPDWSAWIWAHHGALEQLLEDFPRIWTHQGAAYTCTVRPRARTVVLEPANKAARKAADPDARFVPRFRGFKVRYVQASRKVIVR